MDELYHYGVKGQVHGIRNGPPYPLYRQKDRGRPFGQYKKDTKDKVYNKKPKRNGRYAKKHIDKVIKQGEELQTLTRDKDRLNNTDMYYACYEARDKAFFMHKFNSPSNEEVFDENGKSLGYQKMYKFNAKTVAKTDIKVASDDTIYKTFKKLYENDKDFYGFVTDKNRLYNNLHKSGYGPMNAINPPYIRGLYKLKRGDKSKSTINEKDLKSICECFMLNLPYDGRGNKKEANDAKRQRFKLFKELKKSGYGALIDSYDAMYFSHTWKINAPVVVFDMEQVIPKEVLRTTIKDVKQSKKDYRRLTKFGLEKNAKL